jgi:hypothetical protein
LQTILDQIPEDYLQQVDQAFALVQNGVPQIHETPYSLLAGIQISAMMTDKTYDQIKLMVDYSLTFTESYTCSPKDILRACIELYAAHHSEALVLLDGL